MQAFAIRSGIGTPTCDDVPPSLLIQTPQRHPVTITVNSADVTIGSTALLTFEDDTLQLSVLDGGAILSNGIAIGPGFTVDAITNADGTITDWQRIRPIAANDLADYRVFEVLDETVMNYPVVLPALQVQTTPNTSGLNTGENGSSSGVVSPSGDTNGEQAPSNPPPTTNNDEDDDGDEDD